MTNRTVSQLRDDAFTYAHNASARGYDVQVIRYNVAMDNYELPRLIITGYAVRYSVHVHGTVYGIYMPCDDANGIPLGNALNANALFDSGQDVSAYYCAGWNPYDSERARDPALHFGSTGPSVLWHPFPLSAGTRPDGRPVDMSSWMLGPRKTYHFKVTPLYCHGSGDWRDYEPA